MHTEEHKILFCSKTGPGVSLTHKKPKIKEPQKAPTGVCLNWAAAGPANSPPRG